MITPRLPCDHNSRVSQVWVSPSPFTPRLPSTCSQGNPTVRVKFHQVLFTPELPLTSHLGYPRLYLPATLRLPYSSPASIRRKSSKGENKYRGKKIQKISNPPKIAARTPSLPCGLEGAGIPLL